MKEHVTDYATRVYCARIEPTGDHPIIRLSGYPADMLMSNGQLYLTENGYEFSGQDDTAGFSASSVDLNGILKIGAVTQQDLASGVYDNARVYVFATSWAAPVEDEEPLGLMFWGRVEFDAGLDIYKVQLMGAKDALSQAVGRTYAATCPWTLFDQSIDGRIIATSRSRCTGPRSAPDGPAIADYRVSGALTAVADQYLFSDAARSEDDDWFAYGEIMFTSGANVGLRPSQIKVFAGGQIELHEALFYAPQIGDAYMMTPGCRKRLSEDCVGKFGNGLNNGGQAHVPAPSQYSEVGRGA